MLLFQGLRQTRPGHYLSSKPYTIDGLCQIFGIGEIVRIDLRESQRIVAVDCHGPTRARTREIGIQGAAKSTRYIGDTSLDARSREKMKLHVRLWVIGIDPPKSA